MLVFLDSGARSVVGASSCETRCVELSCAGGHGIQPQILQPKEKIKLQAHHTIGTVGKVSLQ